MCRRFPQLTTASWKCLWGGLVWLALSLTAGWSVAADYPFGSHPVTYTAGSIRPDHRTQAQLDQAVADFYDAWKATYVSQDCDAGRYVVRAAVDRANLTVSEAHGYGMMISALMAGHDPEAHAVFDGMYAYFREHPTALHARLMSWFQNKACNDANGRDSASDGDLDIAYALLLADKQWGSCGAVDYAAEAAAMMSDLLDGDMDATGEYALLGDWVRSDDPTFYRSTRSSDFMPDHFRSFAAVLGGATWNAAIDRGYAVFDTLQTSFSPVAGLLPDFILDPLGSPSPAGPNFLEAATDGAYGYNATRDPWRIATDYLLSGDSRAKTVADRISAWIRWTTGDDPTAIRAGYRLDGTPVANSDFLTLAFVAPFAAAATVDPANQLWLDALWDQIVGEPVGAEGYFEDTLKMLSMLVVSGNWWAPESVAQPACVPDSTRLCRGGGYLSSVDLKAAKLGEPVGDEKLRLKGDMFFPQGVPVTPSLAVGMQMLIEDEGSGDAAILELSDATADVPAADGTFCGSRDGWKIKPGKAVYRNRSGALDAPTCTPGSAQGLVKVSLRSRGSRDVQLKILVRRATLPSIAAPLRVTLVLGDTAAAGDAGSCAIVRRLVCMPHGSGLRCR